MLAKVLVLVAWMGLTACGLLALRQSRLQCAHELAQVQLRIARHDEALWKERVRIARAVTPSRVQEMAARLGPLRPLLAEGGEALAGTRGGPSPPEEERARADAAIRRGQAP